MSERILTLFGEEIIPEQPKAEQKARAKKKVEEKEKKPDEIVADEQEAITEQSIAETEKQELAPELPATDGLPGAGTGETIDEDYTVTPAQPSAEISIEPITPLAWAIPEQVEEIQEKEPAPVTQATEFTEEINDQPTSVTQVDSPTAIAEKIKADHESASADETVITIPQEKETNAKSEQPFYLPEDWNGDKRYYAIGEVAELFKVKTSHIRFWTNEFKLKVRTTGKGDRLFTADQIRELRAIHHLVKERGFTLAGAKAKLKSQNKRDVETIDLKQSLLQLRGKLLTIRNQLV